MSGAVGHVGGRSVVGEVLARAEEHPDRVAIDTVERSITYRELIGRAGGWALALRAVDASGPVIVLLDDGIELAARALAALSLGRAFVPVAADIAPEALLELADALGAPAVAASDARRLGSVRASSPPILLDADGIVPAPLERPAGPCESLSLASTSGSTGTPKVVRLLEEEVLGVLDGHFGAADPNARDVNAMTLSPATFAVVGLFRGLVLGIVNVCGDPLRVPLPALVRRWQERRVTFLRLVPSVLRRVVRAVPEGQLLDALRVVQLTGETLTWSDVATTRRVLPTTAVIHNRFGMTEVGEVAIREVGAADALGVGAVPIGRALPGRRVRIEREPGVETEVDEVGELVLEGAFRRIAPQAEPLVGGGWRLRTGDLARRDAAGEVHLLGRLDRMVKVSGVRVEPAVVEDAIQSVPGVSDVVVAPVLVSSGAMVLVAFVVVADGTAIDADVLRVAVARAAPTAAVPARFVLRTEPFPQLTTGKADVGRLVDELGGPTYAG